MRFPETVREVGTAAPIVRVFAVAVHRGAPVCTGPLLPCHISAEPTPWRRRSASSATHVSIGTSSAARCRWVMLAAEPPVPGPLRRLDLGFLSQAAFGGTGDLCELFSVPTAP